MISDGHLQPLSHHTVAETDTSTLQVTIGQPVTVHGVCIDREQYVTCTLYPGKEDSGIVFIREDLAGQPAIPCDIKSAVVTNRWTTLETAEAAVHGTEHLLAAVFGLGIDNLEIHLDGPSVPVMRGCNSLDFCKALQRAGRREQTKPKKCLSLTAPLITVDAAGSGMLIGLPYPGLKITYVLHYPHKPAFPAQIASYLITPAVFAEEISPARSFLLQYELADGKKAVSCGALREVLVIDEQETAGLLFPDEPARHKLLDLLGDLGTIGRTVHGHFIGIRSGHRLNHQFCCELARVLGITDNGKGESSCPPLS